MTILLLEDEPAVLKLAIGMLRPHTVFPATTWDEAMEVFRSNPSGIDLLIADVTIPVLSGVQVARLIRGDKPGLPVILVSGYPLANWAALDSSELAKLGTDSVVILEKPFARQQLLEAIRSLTGGAWASVGNG